MPARASCLYLALAAALALSARAAAPEPAQLEKPQPLTPHWGSCPDCAPAPPADALRLEAIKLQILTRLGLDDRPAPRRPLPRAMLLETLAKAAEEDGEVAGAGGSYRQGLLEREQNEAEEHIADSALDYDDYFGRTSEIIVFAEPGLNYRLHSKYYPNTWVSDRTYCNLVSTVFISFDEPTYKRTTEQTWRAL